MLHLGTAGPRPSTFLCIHHDETCCISGPQNKASWSLCGQEKTTINTANFEKYSVSVDLDPDSFCAEVKNQTTKSKIPKIQ